MSAATRLGRWCGPWYSNSCNTVLKGWLNDHDHSVWNHAPVQSKQLIVAAPDTPPEEPRRDPVSALLAQWHGG